MHAGNPKPSSLTSLLPSSSVREHFASRPNPPWMRTPAFAATDRRRTGRCSASPAEDGGLGSAKTPTTCAPAADRGTGGQDGPARRWPAADGRAREAACARRKSSLRSTKSEGSSVSITMCAGNRSGSGPVAPAPTGGSYAAPCTSTTPQSVEQQGRAALGRDEGPKRRAALPDTARWRALGIGMEVLRYIVLELLPDEHVASRSWNEHDV